MALRRVGGAAEADSPVPSFRRRRWSAARTAALVCALGAVGAVGLALLPAASATPTTPPPGTPAIAFLDQCDGTVLVTVTNPAGNAPIGVAYGTPGSFESVFDLQTPAEPDWVDDSPQPVTLGTWVTPSVAGLVYGIRWYFPASPVSGQTLGLLYDSTGTELARAAFSSPVPGEWNQVLFSSPVAVGAGDFVAAAVYTHDRYVASGGMFASTGITHGVLTAPKSADAPVAGNGVFNYSGPDAGFPSGSFNSTGYFADVLFAQGGVVEDDGVEHVVTAPEGVGEITVTGVSPALTHTWAEPDACTPPTTTPAGDPTTSTPVDDPTTSTPADDPTTSTAADDPTTTAGVTPSPVTTGSQLPKTGDSLTGVLWAGLALILTGATVLLLVSDARSRRRTP